MCPRARPAVRVVETLRRSVTARRAPTAPRHRDRGGTRMRMMMKVQLPVEAANEAIRSGMLPKTIEMVSAMIKPEASYFTTEDGMRTSYMFFDMKNPAQMPEIAEPAFMNLNAKVDFVPVMNQADLETGLQAA